jgi:hypothetical protein
MTDRKRRMFSRAAILLAAAALVAFSGCATTRQTRSVQPHGFLEDYSMLRKGEKNEAQLIYINEDADFSQYNAALLESVTIWFTESTEKLSVEDQQMLTDHLFGSIYDELDQAFEMVDKPGPKVLRIRAALTEAKGARVVGKTVTSIIPQLRLLTTLAGVATDTQVFVGKATIEVDITDSLSDERLAAAVDQRSGTKALRALGGQWKDVNNAFDYWASRIRIKLVELRNGDATTG